MEPKLTISSDNGGYVLEAALWLPRRRDDVFPFFADALNLQELTPPWLHFEMLTRGPIEMKVGTLIEYKLRIRGVPVRWQSEITVWEPPHRFVDEQRRGPYRYWIHEHIFKESDGGTACRDRVRYGVTGGGLVHRMLVKPDLTKIFEYRRKRLEELFGHPS
jgi:ligand-binding SRPBCC domain-containing protein